MAPSDDVQPRQPFFALALKIQHPTRSKDEVTREIGLEPTGGWDNGERRKTPAGTLLPGLRKGMYWYLREEIADNRLFFSYALDLAERVIEPRAKFFKPFIGSGGRITIFIHLPGSINIGDDLEASDVQYLAELGIGLSVEVFPHFKLRDGESRVFPHVTRQL